MDPVARSHDRRPNRATLAWRYATLGVLLGLGSPYGLFLARAVANFHGEILDWWLREAAAMRWIFLYTGMGSVLVFGLFGYFLGRRQDALSGQVRAAEREARRFERSAITDPLTKLYAHGYLLNRLNEEFQRAKRYAYGLACLFMDIDGFKSLNDRHGHLFGDEVLARTARALAAEMRDTDVVGRYGGDEFVAILPQTSAVAAYKVAERVRKRAAALQFPAKDGEARVTLSIGIYASESLPSSPSDVLEMADRALRQAKTVGRNRSILLFTPERVRASAQSN